MKEFEHLDDEERLRAENDFLKMKLMLERGAVIASLSDNPIPSAVENAFLNNIIAFEKEFDNRKKIKVFDKIGRPIHFKAAAMIPDDEIVAAWESVRDLLNEHSIDLGACSPNVTHRELYRFATEELFELEMDDINLEGWVTDFIYDEFYPDPVYENTFLVKDDLLHDIFSQRELCSDMFYSDEFEFNREKFTDFSNFFERIQLFKSLYEDIELVRSDVESCQVDGDQCIVSGSYCAVGKNGLHEDYYAGTFRVELTCQDTDHWYFISISIEGFNP